MRLARFAVIFAAVAGTASGATSGHEKRDDLSALHSQGVSFFQKGEYSHAIQIFERALEITRGSKDVAQQVTYLSNLMSCRFALRQYRPAAGLYEQAKALAHKSADHEGLAILAINMSSLYSQMGNTEAALRLAKEARISFSAVPQSKFWDVFLLQEGLVLSASGHHNEAMEDLRQSIAEAALRGDAAIEARAWEQLGSAQWNIRDFAGANTSFQKAAQMQIARQKETSPDLERRIALLRQSQGNQAESLAAFDRALGKSSRIPNSIPFWLLPYQKGVLLRQMGRQAEAVAVLDSAVDLARKWRRTVLPAGSADQTDAGLSDLYNAYLNAGFERMQQSPDKLLLRRLFRASEEDRALSAQAESTPALQWQNRVKPSYWEQAAELRALYAQLAGSSTPASERRIAEIEGSLNEQEMAAGLDLPELKSRPEQWLRATSVPADQLFLSFHVSSEHSYLFALTEETLQLYRLPSREGLRAKISRFRESVQAESAQVPALGKEIYASLFGQLPPGTAARTHWMIAFDDQLFELPIAALTLPAGNYLIESHSVETAPNLQSIQPRPGRNAIGTLVALGDPVFHAADSRWKWKAQGASAGPVLPRLPGSGKEVRQCVKSWHGPSILLTGNDVTLERLSAAVQTGPKVIHFATHIVPARGNSGQPLIAMGTGARAENEYLTTRDIAKFHLAGGLVVMNGCHSGAGKALPQAGWMGLTRAWIMAGAQNVIASYWPTSDDGSPFFAQFYSAYQQKSPTGRFAADALREAQLEMLHSGTWRAQPKYWAAYFITGRN